MQKLPNQQEALNQKQQEILNEEQANSILMKICTSLEKMGSSAERR